MNNLQKDRITTDMQLVCESQGWEFELDYNAGDWRADILISKDGNNFAFSSYLSSADAYKELAEMENDGVKGYGLIHSHSDEDFEKKYACFNVRCVKDVYRVFVAHRNLSLSNFMKKALAFKIVPASRAQIVAVDVLFNTIKCFNCGMPHAIYIVRYLIDAKGEKYDIEYIDGMNPSRMPDLQFGAEIRDIVMHYIAAHPEKGITMGEIKNRYSKTMGKSYMSFGCPRCDAILGDFYLNEEYIEMRYVTDEELMHRMQLRSPFELIVSDWSVL